MSEPDAGLTELFRDETTQRLDQIDTALLAIESGSAGAEAVDSLFRNVHTIKGAAAMLGFDDVRALAHAAEDVLASVRASAVPASEVAAPLLRATAALRAQLTGDGRPIDALVGELAALSPPPEAGSPQPSAPGTPAGPTPGNSSAGGRDQGAQHSLRVPAAKLDHLIDVTAEIMEYRSSLTHKLGQRRLLSQDVADTLGAGGRMLAELRDTAFGMRTLPLSAITGPLPRAIRDLARTTGKDIEFAVIGAGTELDRVILESLSEPLTHLLSNAVVHGIEPSAERERAGKQPRGRVELRAVPRGSMVEIVVADDGQGVVPEVIEEARRQGSLADVLARSGYSTAGDVTNLAGRGVGLDAVRSYAQSLGGGLEVRSEPGRGTEIVLLLPLALALLDVLLFERGGAAYGVPVAAVEEVVAVARTFTLEGRPAVEIRGKSLPFADFAALIGAGAPPPGGTSPALVIRAGGRRVVATCDALHGQEEVIVKPLGPFFGGLDRYLGAAVLGDGRIALLVEPGALTRESRRLPGAPGTPAADPAVTRSAAAPKILVVEDSFSVRELQRSILETAGYPVVTARDGRDALEALGRDPEIALVITDIEMPGLDGLELTRAIRGHATRSSLPVVIVTSSGSEEDRRRGIEAGADAYMAKRSFDQQALLVAVERLVGW
jgi:two-component system, chemotaxis family, sensor kinase CheA